MRRLPALLFLCVLFAAFPAGFGQEKSPRTALMPLGTLVGTWKATGVPSGSREEQEKGFWTETISCQWQFKGEDAWLKVDFEKGKHFVSGDLHYLPDPGLFRLTLKTPAKEARVFTGLLKDKVLALTRHDPEAKEDQKLVVTLLHDNRFLYRYEVRPEGKGLFSKRFQVGATKEGIPFATGDGRPECVVSGGLGTIPVSYLGKTYYVCCGGCRDEFRDNPKKYIEEYEMKSKTKGK